MEFDDIAETLPWEQQAGETSKSFNAFQAFRDLGPLRTVRDAMKVVLGAVDPAAVNWSRWRTENQWDARAIAYDRHLDRIRQREHVKKVTEMTSRHAQISEAMQRKVVDRLKEIKAQELRPIDMIRWFETAVKIERLSRGEATEIQGGTTVQATVPLDLSKLSDEQLDQLQRISSCIRSGASGDSEGASGTPPTEPNSVGP